MGIKVGMRLYGAEAGYEEQVGSQTRVATDRSACIDLRETLACMVVPTEGGLMEVPDFGDAVQAGG